MAQWTLSDLSKKMAKLDFAMLGTHSATGGITARPMSNNGDVDFDGDSYFFAYEQSRKIAEIRAHPEVMLSYTGAVGMLGGPPLFIAIEGRAALIQDRARFEEHWTKDLDRYFPDGIDTPGVMMIQVHAERIRYWDGGEEGEVAA
ncbi:pyridoxamine 5'-phosphate oxidase family protein [Sphingomonas sp. SORGH_AS_0879]|uniref:pyridoxamine 5'-phosphate oxidase family protein n=1 Tax=Sphingomonas sp. SORGH_AS_0879 TaxID=3041790 RepID=UPI002785D967|nr:pyridoxamine 5'-phosphate oxidase family protein [Sphingomonas sp. SORGH_AS_0879]MDQ1231096.1 general stress protein 26 [Sphingomonas sp. SORGH_AS_0879]